MVSSTSVAEALPVFYSFRRCPYAMRARLALAAAGWRPGENLELREVSLQAKPPELLEASAKGTVPVLVLSDGTVLEQSLAIMGWALEQADPHGWLAGWSAHEAALITALIAENDGPFKHHLDRFKYPDRFGDAGLAQRPAHRTAAVAILRAWGERLQRGGWLLGDRPALADWALLPFVRQFRLADPEGFAAELSLNPLQAWLQGFESSPALAAVMAPPWGPRRPWCSAGWLYHLALPADWQAARAQGAYRISTRGRSLEQEGFIHASYAYQIEATYRRFYGDLRELRLLRIDPGRLQQLGVDLRAEPAPGSGELFPHLYGPLPLEAVLQVEAYP